MVKGSKPFGSALKFNIHVYATKAVTISVARSAGAMSLRSACICNPFARLFVSSNRIFFCSVNSFARFSAFLCDILFVVPRIFIYRLRPEALKSMVPKIITRDEATKIYQYVPNLKKAIQVAERVSNIEGASVRKRYIKILGTTKRMSHKKALKRAKELTLQKKIRFELTKRRAKGLQIQAERKDMAPADLATEIVTAWLRKRGY